MEYDNKAYASTNGSGIYMTASGTSDVNNDIAISRSYGTLNIAEAIEEIQKRLCILQPDFNKMEKYPALKAAYDNYKLVEALINEGSDV